MSMLTAATTILALASIHASSASAPSYILDPSWPVSKSTAALFTAAAVDSTVYPTEIYVAQRSAAYPEPIMVFSEDGVILRSWGNDTVSFIDNEWGVHGIQLQFDTPNGTVLILTDMLQHTVKKYTTTGVLLEMIGTPNEAGSGFNPVQFGNVADAAVGRGEVLIADGDGGVNNRVDGFDASLGPALLFAFGGAGSGIGQFSSPHRFAVNCSLLSCIHTLLLLSLLFIFLLNASHTCS